MLDRDPNAAKGEVDSKAVYERQQDQEAHNRAAVLEMIGDLPEADAAPPPNVLFVCKLNPVTEEEDLEIIFSRFGKLTSCDLIRDNKTGESLCYAFISFEKESSCEEAFFKVRRCTVHLATSVRRSLARRWPFELTRSLAPCRRR
jgi:RNA recognition motif-containing protein